MGQTPNASREAMLIQWAKSGPLSERREAETAILAEFEGELRAVVLSFPRVPGLSFDDAMQAARYGLLQALRRFDPNRVIRLWSYAREFVRAQIRRDGKAQSLEYLPLTAAEETAASTSSLEHVDDAITLSLCLRSLRPRERYVVVSRHLKGHSATELARHLRVTPAAVSMIERRAIDRLRALPSLLAA